MWGNSTGSEYIIAACYPSPPKDKGTESFPRSFIRMTFKHFILTRFNLPIFQPKVGEKKVSHLDEEYLNYRFDLFERFCLPSVKGQTCQDFRWFVLFDAATPAVFRKRIGSLQEEYDRLIPCFVDTSQVVEMDKDYLALVDEYDRVVDGVSKRLERDYDVSGGWPLKLIIPPLIKEIINDQQDNEPEWYLTTRLDNDDALHEDFVKEVQARFKTNPEHKVLDFVNTFKYIQKEGIVYSYPLVNGHFITLAEPSGGVFQSVLFWNHVYVDRFLPVEHIFCYPLQLEVVHGGNVINDFTGISLRGLLRGLMSFRKREFHCANMHLPLMGFVKFMGLMFKKKIQRTLPHSISLNHNV